MPACVQLVRGRRVKLSDLTPETRLEVVLTLRGPLASDLRFLCLLTGADEHTISGSEVVFEGRPTSRCRALGLGGRTPSSQAFTLDLSRVPGEVARLVFVAALFDQNRDRHPEVSLVTEGSFVLRAGGEDVAVYTFHGGDFDRETALCVGEIYRKETWRLSATGSGFRGGLAAIANRYKVAPALASSIERGEKVLSAASPGVRVPGTPPGGLPPVVPKSLLPAVGFVMVSLAGNETASGTGFVISPGGHVLTCYHVVEGATAMAIALGGSMELRPLVPIAADAGSDLALLRIGDDNGSPHWLTLAAPTSEPDLGQAVGLLGYPLSSHLGLEVNYSQGIINSRRTMGSRPVLQLDAGAAPGSSGGPVFDRTSGNVVGVLTSGITGPNTGILVNFAIDLRALWKLDWLRPF